MANHSNTLPVQDWSKINDKYAKPIYESIHNFASSEGLPSPQAKIRGETENHSEERLVGIYGKSPKSTSASLTHFYGEGLRQRGNQGGEALFSVSHWGHFGAARGPALFFAMMAGDDPLTEIMVRVWMADYASFILLSDPTMTAYASPCARLLDGADQRDQLIATMRWLAGKSIRTPKTLSYAPDWLGLYALTLIQEAYDTGKDWASNWPHYQAAIVSADTTSILPLKFPLTIEKSALGHLAYFSKPFPNKKGSSVWSRMEYDNPSVEYGVSDPTTLHSLKGVILRPVNPMPKCPGVVNQVFKFPVVDQGNKL